MENEINIFCSHAAQDRRAFAGSVFARRNRFQAEALFGIEGGIGLPHPERGERHLTETAPLSAAQWAEHGVG